MDLRLTDKIAVISGASKGIGLAVTQALVQEGAYVVVGARDTKSLEGLDRVTPVAVDLTSPDGPAWLVQTAIAKHGRIDALVNNVGAVRLRLDGFVATSDDDFQWAMQMNFFTTLRATRRAGTDGRARRRGDRQHCVGQRFLPARRRHHRLRRQQGRGGQPHQVAGPGVRTKGIHVNAVSPGPVSTELWLGEHGVAHTVGKAMGVDADTARERIVAGIGGFATGEFTKPEEVATLVVLLVSDRTANVTGANYIIDGGLIKTT
jgi:NAD(P)-dependent dehydrogenase (short-subunit alcohol dehydrogenase family)